MRKQELGGKVLMIQHLANSISSNTDLFFEDHTPLKERIVLEENDQSLNMIQRICSEIVEDLTDSVDQSYPN